MIIKLKEAIEIEVVESYDDETEEVVSCGETFEAGEELDVDIFNDHSDTVDVQFGDGSVTYNLPKSTFTIIKE